MTSYPIFAVHFLGFKLRDFMHKLQVPLKTTEPQRLRKKSGFELYRHSALQNTYTECLKSKPSRFSLDWAGLVRLPLI